MDALSHPWTDQSTASEMWSSQSSDSNAIWLSQSTSSNGISFSEAPFTNEILTGQVTNLDSELFQTTEFVSLHITNVIDTTAINVTNSSTLASKRSSRPDPTEVDRYMWIYWSPITFTVGFLGNLFILLVLRHFWKHSGKNKKSSSRAITVYLAVMAVADLVFLIFGIVPEWLEAMEYLDFGEVHPFSCKVEKFTFYTSGDVAIWIICVFNVDRFIAVCFPLKQNCKCMRRCLRHPITVSAVVTFAACAKNLHVFWTRGYTEDGDFVSNCGRPEPYTYFEEYIRPWIAFILVSLIPSIVIIICNISIIVTLKRATKMRAQNSSSESGFLQTIFMCMSASIAFLLCITPSMIIYIGRAYWTDPDDPESNPYGYDIAKAVNNQLAYVNHSINFFLYCTTGKRFRDTFKMMLMCADEKTIARNKTWQTKTVISNHRHHSNGSVLHDTKSTTDTKPNELSIPDVTSKTSLYDMTPSAMETSHDSTSRPNSLSSPKEEPDLTKSINGISNKDGSVNDDSSPAIFSVSKGSLNRTMTSKC